MRWKKSDDIFTIALISVSVMMLIIMESDCLPPSAFFDLSKCKFAEAEEFAKSDNISPDNRTIR